MLFGENIFFLTRNDKKFIVPKYLFEALVIIRILIAFHREVVHVIHQLHRGNESDKNGSKQENGHKKHTWMGCDSIEKSLARIIPVLLRFLDMKEQMRRA